MEVQIDASESDQGTHHIAEAVRPHLDKLSLALSGEYGGPMEHLWIHLELMPSRTDIHEPFPFRFQKRVAPPRELKPLGATERFNVGHFSVRPDYFALARVPLADVPCYLMAVVYDATGTLESRKQLSGFNARAFRERFAQFLRASGCAANNSLEGDACKATRASS
jgi:hypothetical protein